MSMAARAPWKAERRWGQAERSEQSRRQGPGPVAPATGGAGWPATVIPVVAPVKPPLQGSPAAPGFGSQAVRRRLAREGLSRVESNRSGRDRGALTAGAWAGEPQAARVKKVPAAVALATVVLALVAPSLLYLSLQAQRMQLGRELYSLQLELAQVEKEVAHLRVAAEEARSLARVEQAARLQLGMVRPAMVQTVALARPLAADPSNVEAQSGPAEGGGPARPSGLSGLLARLVPIAGVQAQQAPMRR